MKTNYHKKSQPGKTTIFYYTGTGNSLWLARALARELGNTELVSIVGGVSKEQMINSSALGLAFPVHIWGVPRRVLGFLDDLSAMSPEYVFALASNGGQVSNTLVQLQKAMTSRGLTLDGGWSVVMPSNYIPWGGPGSLAEQNELFQEASLKIAAIAEKIRSRVKTTVEKGPLWQRIVFSGIYKMTYPLVPKMDDKFWIDHRCNQCGFCIKLCPAQNIASQEGKIVWQNHCEQCLACLQWCPQEALQYGKKTPAYARYQHPEIKMKDLIK